MWKEFKEFAVKGNAIDLAVGVIIGAAFGKIVTSIVEDLLMFVLCFVKRMIPVVTNFDWPPAGVIQPQKGFVNSFQDGRIAAASVPRTFLR